MCISRWRVLTAFLMLALAAPMPGAAQSAKDGEGAGKAARDDTSRVTAEMVENLNEAAPDIIMIGNSMQGQGIDFGRLSDELGMKVYDLRRGGSMTAWHYSVLEYVLPRLEKTPKMVLVVERKNHFTSPQKRAGREQERSRRMAWNEDWDLVHRLAMHGEGQPEWEPGEWDSGRTPLDGFYWDFARAVRWSLLPHMIESAKATGYQLVVVRHKSRVFAEQPDYYPQQMKAYANAMAYYLQSHDVPFLDYERNDQLAEDLYANGDHLNVIGRDIWTGLMARDVKALLAGERAPNQHLPPDDYEPSSQLQQLAGAIPKLPESRPESIPPVPPRPEPLPPEPTPEAVQDDDADADDEPSRPEVSNYTIDNLESVIYVGRDMMEQRVILATVVIPGPNTNMGWMTRRQRSLTKGAEVLDIMHVFQETENPGELYLSPTTLSPKGVEVVATAVADEIREKFPYMQWPLKEYETSQKKIESSSGMTFTINQVHEAGSGELMQAPQQGHQVRMAIVGDHNVGIYSDPALGMGQSAGLPEHLAKELGRPLTSKWRAERPKQGLPNMLKELNLNQTSVVVWVYMFEEMVGPRWARIERVHRKEYDQPNHLIVRARIKELSPPPTPDLHERYPDTVNYTLWEVQEVVEGEYDGELLRTAEWSQKDLDFLAPFDYEKGDQYTLELMPLRSAERQNRAIRKADFVDTVGHYDVPPFWILAHEAQ